MTADSKITTLDTPTTPATAAKAKETSALVARSSGSSAGLSGKKVEINIYASDKEFGNNAVEIGLNGVMYLVPRGQYFSVPEELADVLRNAVITVTTANPAGGGVIERDVPRYNFQVR